MAVGKVVGLEREPRERVCGAIIKDNAILVIFRAILGHLFSPIGGQVFSPKRGHLFSPIGGQAFSPKEGH